MNYVAAFSDRAAGIFLRRVRASARCLTCVLPVVCLAFASSPLNAQALFEFTGRSDQRERFGFDDPAAFNAPLGHGAFKYWQLSEDKDSDPKVGDYDVLVEDFRLEFAGDILEIPEISVVATVKDGSGCDCLYFDIPYAGTLANQPFDRLFLRTDDDFSLAPGTTFDSDVLPLDSIRLPALTNVYLQLYVGDDLTLFEIVPETVKISRLPVPEPSSMVLFLAAIGAVFSASCHQISVQRIAIRRLPKGR